MTSNLSQKVFSGSIFQYSVKIVITIFGFLTNIYIIRKLNVEEYGLYNFLLSIILLSGIATSFGLAPIVQRYLSEYREKNNNYFQKRILSLAVFIRFVVGFVFILCLLLANNWIIDTFNLPTTFKSILPLISLIILLTLESQLLGDAALLSLFENKYWSISRSVYSILKFFLFFLMLKLGYGIRGIVWGWLIIEVLLFILFLMRVWKVVFSLPVRKEEIQPLPLRRFLKFGLPLWFQNVFYLFRDKATDIFILSYFLGQKEVGLYSFAFGIPLTIMSFSPGNILRPVTTPALIRKYTKDSSKEALSYFFQFMNRVIFFTMVPISLALIILSNEIIKYVFTPAYLEVLPLFILSSGFLMISQFNYAYSSILYALEKSKIMFIASWSAVYNLIMDLILIPKFGILGAILATGSAGVFLLPYYYFTLKKEGEIKLKYPWKSFIKFSLNTIPFCIVLFLMKNFISNAILLIGILIVGAIIYLISSYLNKGFDEKDRELFNRTIGKKLWVF